VFERGGSPACVSILVFWGRDASLCKHPCVGKEEGCTCVCERGGARVGEYTCVEEKVHVCVGEGVYVDVSILVWRKGCMCVWEREFMCVR